MKDMRRYFFGLVVVCGCGPVAPGGVDSGAGTTTSVEVGSTSVGVGVTGGVVGSTSGTPTSGGGVSTADVTGIVEASTSAGSSATEGATFLMGTDMAVLEPCDVFGQDCPRGEKCAPYANDGGSSWNDTKCVPVVEDPRLVGESCTVVGNGVSGIDDCEFGALCWDTDVENHGTCVEQCSGSWEAPECPVKFVCAMSGEVLNLCLKGCDPLGQDCPMSDDLCIPADYGFLCVLDASEDEGQVNDPCMYANSCDAGLYCVGSMHAIECDQRMEGCCQPFCDVTLANTCAGVGQECVAWSAEGEAPPGYENVGICGVPE